MRQFKDVFEFRPLKQYSGMLRYNNGVWIPDDGEYDLAFVYQDRGFPTCEYFPTKYYENILWSWCKNGNWGATVRKHPNGNAWHYMLKEGETTWGKDIDTSKRSKHPNNLAGESGMSYMSSKHGCANGRHVEFNINSATINAGLVRNRETKELLATPDIFVCMYCGEIDWKKEEGLKLLEV